MQDMWIRIGFVTPFLAAFYVTHGFGSTWKTAVMAGIAGGCAHLFAFCIRTIRRDGAKAPPVIGIVSSIVASTVAVGVFAIFTVRPPERQTFFEADQIDKLDLDAHARIKVHGFIASGSIDRDGATTRFVIAKNAMALATRYTGPLPDAFKDGMEVVATGTVVRDAQAVMFVATDLAAKCPDTYNTKDGPMPAAKFR